MKKRITLVDVAEAAKVSTTTVSLVLRDSPQIPPKTKRLVRAAAERVGYVYNQSAANMRGSNQTLVGMVMSGSVNRFNAEVVADISRICAENGKVMLYGDADENLETQKKILKRMVENNVANMFVCAAEGSMAADFELVKEHGIRVIQVLRNITDLDAPYIGFDNVGAAEKLTTHLIRDGHRRVAFLGGSPTSSSREERRVGYELAHRRNGIKIDWSLDIPTTVTRRAGFEAMGDLLNLKDPPTAVFCYNDVLAYGAMLLLRSREIEIGKEVAVAGFDDLEESSLWSPSLTSVALDRPRLVQQAFRTLTDTTMQDGQVNIAISPNVVLRNSTRLWSNG